MDRNILQRLYPECDIHDWGQFSCFPPQNLYLAYSAAAPILSGGIVQGGKRSGFVRDAVSHSEGGM